MIGEVLPAPSLVEQVAEVDDIEAQLEVLLAERLQRLADADVDVVLPWVATGIAAKKLASAVLEAGHAIDVAIERIRFGCRFELLRGSGRCAEAREKNLVR